MAKDLLNKSTILASVIATLIALPFFWVLRRNHEMERLYLVAIGQESFDSAKSQAAVKELNKFSDRRATEYLLKIATESPTSDTLGSAQTAISSLATRNDPEIADRLSSELQLYQSLDTRLRVTKALAKLPCEFECIRSILNYQERRWHGEPTMQEQFTTNSSFDEKKNTDLEKKEQDISQLLNSVLVREQSQTIVVLMRIYGLGTKDPSLFALKIVQELGLQQSCTLLVRSFRGMDELAQAGYKGPIQQTRSAIEALKCQSSE